MLRETKELDYLFLQDRQDYFQNLISGTFDPNKKTRLQQWLEDKVRQEMIQAGIIQGVSDGNGNQSTVPVT
jgi:hypothetical protein